MTLPWSVKITGNCTFSPSACQVFPRELLLKIQKIEMKLTKQNGTDVSRRQIQPIYKGFQKNKKKGV